MVTVAGEAGIGKSRLARELLVHAGGRRVLVGRCHPVPSAFSLGPVIDALRGTAGALSDRALSPLTGVVRPLLPELGPVLPRPLARLADPRAERYRMFRALRELLGALGPVLWLIEDVHCVDAETLDFLSFLLADPPRDFALVLTYRAEELARPLPVWGPSLDVHVQAIELGPLSVGQVGELAADLLGAETVSEAWASQLHARTGGVPFAVEEVVRLVSERGGPEAPAASATMAGLEVPARLRLWILERLGRLGADARAVVRAAAVLVLPADEGTLAAVAGLSSSRARNGLVEALGRAILAEHERGRYGPRHPLVGQALYEDLSTPLRERLHLRAARALQAEAHPTALPRIAHHFREAGHLRQWVRYVEAAAHAAHAVGDDREAVALLDQALRAPALSRATRVRIAVALGNAALFSISPRRALASLERALDEDTLSRLPPGVRGELRFSLCRIRSHAGRLEHWKPDMERAVGELGRRPELATRAMVNLAQPTRLTEADVSEHLTWLRRAEQARERHRDPVATIALTAQRAAILLNLGDPAGWAAISDIPVARGTADERLQLLRGWFSIAKAAMTLGYYRRAEEMLLRAEGINADLGHEDWGSTLAVVRASFDLALGRWDGLESRARDLDHRTVLASLLLARGALDEALAHVESLQMIETHALYVPVLGDAGATLARLLLVKGDPAGARTAALRPLDAIRRKGGVWVSASLVAREAVDALIACGSGEEARALVREIAAGVRGRDAPAAAAALASCRGALAEAAGRHAEAARWFASSARRWRRLPAPYPSAQASARHGRSLLDGGEERGAEVLLGALAELEELGASWDAAGVRSVLRAHGVALPYPLRGGRRSYEGRLSPREAEVAQLAGIGRTNREIADLLVLSPRTVAHHVSSALHKLGLDSRRSLAGAVPHKDAA